MSSDTDTISKTTYMQLHDIYWKSKYIKEVISNATITKNTLKHIIKTRILFYKDEFGIDYNSFIYVNENELYSFIVHDIKKFNYAKIKYGI
jgi:hypothetical protein